MAIGYKDSQKLHVTLYYPPSSTSLVCNDIETGMPGDFLTCTHVGARKPRDKAEFVISYFDSG